MDDRKEICDAIGMSDTAVESRMEALRKRLLKAVKVDGVTTYKDLSLAVGQNGTFVQQFVTKRSPKRLYPEQYETIVAILDSKGSGEAAAPTLEDERLRKVFERLQKYPKLHDRVISFAEYEMHRYDSERENDTKPAS